MCGARCTYDPETSGTAYRKEGEGTPHWGGKLSPAPRSAYEPSPDDEGGKVTLTALTPTPRDYKWFCGAEQKEAKPGDGFNLPPLLMGSQAYH